uniref:Candidate secreted effector n=1 Tax=Meloidogyne incognita TaxID=6306 RepID=A0A914MAH0_MELIC
MIEESFMPFQNSKILPKGWYQRRADKKVFSILRNRDPGPKNVGNSRFSGIGTARSLKPTSTLPSSSTSLPSPHKRLRKARRSEITPQKRKKVVSTSTTGIGRKRAKRGIKMEKDG